MPTAEIIYVTGYLLKHARTRGEIHEDDIDFSMIFLRYRRACAMACAALIDQLISAPPQKRIYYATTHRMTKMRRFVTRLAGCAIARARLAGTLVLWQKRRAFTRSHTQDFVRHYFSFVVPIGFAVMIDDATS